MEIHLPLYIILPQKSILYCVISRKLFKDLIFISVISIFQIMTLGAGGSRVVGKYSSQFSFVFPLSLFLSITKCLVVARVSLNLVNYMIWLWILSVNYQWVHEIQFWVCAISIIWCFALSSTVAKALGFFLWWFLL